MLSASWPLVLLALLFNSPRTESNLVKQGWKRELFWVCTLARYIIYIQHTSSHVKSQCYSTFQSKFNKYCPNWSWMLYLRKLRKAIERYMPDPKTIQEEQELVPGGDIRILGNAWLRKAWQKSKCTRVPREAEFRKLVRLVAEQHSLCILVKHFFWMIALSCVYWTTYAIDILTHSME